MKKETKNLSWSKIIQLHLRSIADIHRLFPKLYPYMIVQRILDALKPYISIYISAQLINELAGLRRAEVLWFWVFLAISYAVVIALISNLLNYVKNNQTAFFGSRKNQGLLTAKLLSMDYADMDNQNTRDLYYQIMQNENWMNWGIQRTFQLFPNIVKDVTSIIGAIALTYSLFTIPVPDTAGRLTLLNHPLFVPALFLLMIGISALSGFCLSKAAAHTSDNTESAKFSNRLNSFYGKLGSQTKRAADIRLYKQQTISLHYFTHYNIWGLDSKLAKESAGAVGIYSAIADGISALFTGIVYVFSCLKAWTGAFGVGSITQYVGAVTALSGSLSSLVRLVGEMKVNAEYLEITYDFLDIPNSMYQGSLTTEKRSDRQYEVEFQDVSFQYSGTDRWALRHVNVKFQIGSRLAVVGENGSGKTTFIKLLCRLYDPQEGRILLNGIDIRKYNYRDYMNIFSVVFQDFQLLSQPLGANVAGCKAYDRERAKKALINAGFGERLASLPEGLDTQLYKDFSEDGVVISGGEAQKIAIARALYKDAPFIILDEPTAALDPIAEAEIYAQFNQISGDRTAIYISHRLSSCRFCDEILVFDKGEIVQKGSHETLVTLENGKYHELWHAQAQYYAEQ
ncbi:MAG: ABC transporter ATP-binding protein [Lachnospiraceae bacterium]|nr:ABC transporter ATP-binding protein [Lachnospiraceae bacterium]